ncbi:MAG: hypothetical protein A2W28_06200 [Gammaproteobacteria bacterium RBG_16_51_14]|nr:MAG: hypothetical protein A2W28_06200 [Gammaproteobacteria bacterium RBG_16_51_14]
MIILFTDYGIEGPYIGQVQAVLLQHAPKENVINLFADAPKQNPKACAYLLDAYTKDFPPGTIFFCVVDPGVGSFKDKPVVLRIDNRWFVGPDNGLFDIVARHKSSIDCLEITWLPEKLSASFHGRDLYAPVCAMLANGDGVPGTSFKWKDRNHWPDDLAEIIYIDNFGNCITGIRAEIISDDKILRIANQEILYADTFSCVQAGHIFWYKNSSGLIEIAINQGDSAKTLSLGVGARIEVI